MTEDNNLVGTQYSWVSSIFYFGYLLYEYPTTILIQRLPVSKYLTVVTFLWGAVVATTAACSSFGGLATCRFLLGVAVRRQFWYTLKNVTYYMNRNQQSRPRSSTLLVCGTLEMKFLHVLEYGILLSNNQLSPNTDYNRFAGNSVGGFVASLLAYGIGQITHPLHPWQWMFIVSICLLMRIN